MQLSVIIVNYNVKYFLEQCLCSVLNACRNINSEILVVDNNSSDDSKTFLEPKFPSVSFTWNKSNAGFAKANNQALRTAKGEYIVFLNPDTIIPEDCFEKCISFFNKHPCAGALGVHMIDGSGKFLKESKRAFPSPLTSLYKLTGLAKLFPRSKTFARYYLGNLSENEDHEVDVLAGAFMMIPQNVLAVTGSFDEIFFMYGEDIDLSYRIQAAGFKNYYHSKCTIIHFKGESTKRGSFNYVRMFYKAMSLFVKKHYSSGKARFYNILIRIGIFLHAILAFIVNKIQRIGSMASGLLQKVENASNGPGVGILANEKEFDTVRSMLQSAGMQKKMLGRIATNDQLRELIRTKTIDEIIFCEEGLGFAAIIELIQDLPKGIENKFHASGSSSIVGSNSKDESGEYIANKNSIKPARQQDL